MIPALLLILGLIVGSFINAVVWRLKSGESIAHGRSMCPECRHQLAWRDLVPVGSWILLRGKCRYCSRPISMRYPVVEVGSAVLFGLSGVLLTGLGLVSFALWLAILTCVVILGLYDARWYELPNRIMHPALILGLVYFVLRFEPAQGFIQLITAMVTFAVFYGLWWFSEGRLMGGGDSKLVLLMGLVLTSQLLLIALSLGFMLGGVGAAALLARRQKGLTDQIAFGPYLIIGLIFAQFFGTSLLRSIGI